MPVSSRLVTVLVAGWLLSSCASGADQPSESAPTAAATTPSSPIPTPRSSSAGRVVDQGASCFSYVVPRGWQIVDHYVGSDVVYYAVNPAQSWNVASRCTRKSAPTSLAALARVPMREDLRTSRPRRLANVRLDGVPAYHVRGHADGDVNDYFGAYRNGCRVVVWFNLTSAPGRQRLMQSVLRSWRWDS